MQQPKEEKKSSRIIIRLLNLLLLLVIIGVSLYVIKKEEYDGDDTFSFIFKIGEFISAGVGLIGSIISIFLFILYVIRGVHLKKEQEPIKEMAGAYFTRVMSRVNVAFGQFFGLLILLLGSSYVIYYAYSSATNTSGQFVIINYKGSESIFSLKDERTIYLSDTNNHILSSITFHDTPIKSIAVDISRNRVYAISQSSGFLHIINFKNRDTLIATDSIFVGETASVVALNSDGTKLYVAITGGGTTTLLGSISVFDASDSKLKMIHSIHNIGYPISIFIPNNTKSHVLFEASQGWEGNDRLLVFDTKTDEVTKIIPIGAIACNVFATHDGSAAFVSTKYGILYCIKNFTACSPSVKAFSIQQPNASWISSAVVTPDDRTLLLGLYMTKTILGRDSIFGKIISCDIPSQSLCNNKPMDLKAPPEIMAIDPTGNLLIKLPNNVVMRKASALSCSSSHSE